MTDRARPRPRPHPSTPQNFPLTVSEDALNALAERVADLVVDRLAPLLPNAGAGEWMTTAQAAAYLGLTTTALHKLTSARLVPFSQEKPGARCYFKRSDLDSWREASTRGLVP